VTSMRAGAAGSEEVTTSESVGCSATMSSRPVASSPILLVPAKATDCSAIAQAAARRLSIDCKQRKPDKTSDVRVRYVRFPTRSIRVCWCSRVRTGVTTRRGTDRRDRLRVPRRSPTAHYLRSFRNSDIGKQAVSCQAAPRTSDTPVHREDEASPSPDHSPRRRLRPSRRGHRVAYGRFSLVKYVQYYPRCASGRAPRSASRRSPPRAQRADVIDRDVVVNDPG